MSSHPLMNSAHMVSTRSKCMTCLDENKRLRKKHSKNHLKIAVLNNNNTTEINCKFEYHLLILGILMGWNSIIWTVWWTHRNHHDSNVTHSISGVLSVYSLNLVSVLFDVGWLTNDIFPFANDLLIPINRETNQICFQSYFKQMSEYAVIYGWFWIPKNPPKANGDDDDEIYLLLVTMPMTIVSILFA